MLFIWWKNKFLRSKDSLFNALAIINKTRKTKENIGNAMLEKGYRRDCCIIAVGGGVVTDLAGFVASTFGRGIPIH